MPLSSEHTVALTCNTLVLLLARCHGLGDGTLEVLLLSHDIDRVEAEAPDRTERRVELIQRDLAVTCCRRTGAGRQAPRCLGSPTPPGGARARAPQGNPSLLPRGETGFLGARAMSLRISIATHRRRPASRTRGGTGPCPACSPSSSTSP